MALQAKPRNDMELQGDLLVALSLHKDFQTLPAEERAEFWLYHCYGWVQTEAGKRYRDVALAFFIKLAVKLQVEPLPIFPDVSYAEAHGGTK